MKINKVCMDPKCLDIHLNENIMLSCRDKYIINIEKKKINI